MNILYTGTQTVFSSEGPVVNEMSSRACFGGYYFYKYTGEQIYTILFNTTKDENTVPNYCPFSIEEIERHIKELDFFVNNERLIEIINIGPHKSKGPYNYWSKKTEFDWIEVKVKVTGPNKWHRLFMVWIRYMYEQPFQMAMKDAYNLSEELNINPFEAVEITMNGFGTGNTNHTLYGVKRFKFMSRDQFKELFESMPSSVTEYAKQDTNPSLQSLWESCNYPINELNLNNYDAFNWDIGYKERKETYLKIYERINEGIE